MKLLNLTSNSKLRYSDVSYTWGDARERNIVVVDGRLVSVPASSEEALRCPNACFPDGGTCRPWIDAICVDQSNFTERAHQVAFMGDVYSKTERVLVWLGQDDGTIESALV